MSRLFLVVSILALTLLGSCSNSEPQISQVFTQVNRSWDPEISRWGESLAVFLQVSNNDGLEVLERLHILYDESHLHWTLTPASWTRVDRPGETWIGAGKLTTPEGGIPTGAWRVQVATSAGLVTEQVFAVPPEAPGTPPGRESPVKLLAPDDRTGTFVLSGFATDFVIWAYGDNGELLGQKNSTDPRFLLSAVVPGNALAARVRSLVFYSYDKRRGEGLEAGPFALK